MSAVCPACGLAVVPGYVKCPKCQAALPRRPRTFAAGGTAVRDDRFPIAAVAVPGAIVLVLVIWLLARGGGGSDDELEPQQPPPEQPSVQLQPAPQPGRVTPDQPQPVQPVQPARPDPRAAIGELERALRSRRFWSTIEPSGGIVDVRSASCDDAGMRQTIDGAAATLRGAGLTRLRCLAQSGAVVFERDL